MLAIRKFLKEYSRQSSIALFFIWGILLVFFSMNANNILGPVIMVLAHAASIGGIYLGALKDPEGSRSVVGIVLGVLALIYTLALDTLAYLL